MWCSGRNQVDRITASFLFPSTPQLLSGAERQTGFPDVSSQDDIDLKLGTSLYGISVNLYRGVS